MLRVKRERGEASLRNDHGEDEDVKGGEATRIERRLLRSKYRQLKADVHDVKDKLAEVDSFKFKEMFFDRVENLHKLVHKPREQIADAELYVAITNELLDVAKGARRKSGMTPGEFVGAVIHSYGLGVVGDGRSGPKIDWGALGLEACAVLRHAPGVSTMVGPMNVEVKQRRAPISRKRDKPTEKTRPQKVEEVDANRPNTETDANMTTMFGILVERQQIELEHLILNRVSFAQTIENLFALSFLVKDGRVEINFTEDGRQCVVPRNAPTHEERADADGVANTQFVFRLDFGCWRLMQEKVEEGAEVMPHRSGSSPGPAPLPKTSRTPIRKNSRNRARETPSGTPEAEDHSAEGNARQLKRKLISRFSD